VPRIQADADERRGRASPARGQRCGVPGRLRAVGILIVPALAGLWLGSGCTYSFTGSNLPAHVKTVAIPNFSNETLEPGLDQEITTVVIDRFIKDGRLKLASEAKASCRLSGRVVKYENRVNNYASDESPRDYIVVVTVAVTLRDMVKNRDLWKDDSLTRTAIYVPGAMTGPGSEQDARAYADSVLASDMITRTMEPW
jgi:hypothetical protein